MGSPCVNCMSYDTELYRGDDGHFRKRCDNCGHVGGPYTSQNKTRREAEKQGQTSLDQW